MSPRLVSQEIDFLVKFIFIIHFEFVWTHQTFYTSVPLSGYTHIYSNHWWSLWNNDFHYSFEVLIEPQTTICMILNKLDAHFLKLENGVLVILSVKKGLYVSKDQNLSTWRSIRMELLHAYNVDMTSNGSATWMRCHY